MIYKFFDKKSALLTNKYISGGGVNTGVKHNEDLVKDLHQPIIRNFLKKNSLFWI